ncbi:MAG: exosortase-associated EpsI family protein [Kiritimatiellae bacterium]|nr:exosortase-associated EpsI family protein [Kiritimatiellia bacterium]
METRDFQPFLIVLGLMALASLALAFTVDPTMTDESGINPALPDRVGEWRGADVLYCQNPEHQATYLARDLEDLSTCPDCGGELATMSLIEKQILPADTIVLKKQYTSPLGGRVIVSLVMSGKERASIHRPEHCLTGGGSQIVGSHVIEVPIQHRNDLGVKILDMLNKGRTSDGRTVSYPSYYAYWFVGKDRETPSHAARMFWMAADRILFNKSHRWSYISVSGSRQADSDAYEQEIKEFIADLYPQMLRSKS